MKPPRSVNPSILSLALLLLVALQAVVAPNGHAASVSLSGFGTATIDGKLDPAEWAAAGRAEFLVNLPEGGTSAGTVFVMNDANNLYFAVRFARAFADQGNNANFTFDNNHNGVMFENGDDQIFFSTSQGFSDWFRSNQPACPPGSMPGCWGLGDAGYGGTNDGAGAFRNDGAFSTYEFAHPLKSGDVHDFSLAPGSVVGFVLALELINNGVLADTNFPAHPSTNGFADVVITSPAAPANYQGLWWNSPPASESGWGVNFAHQGDIIFATWFTYGADNQPQWYTIRAQKTAANVYAGPVSSFTGLPFNTVPYTANANVKTPVGTATITFTADGQSATFTYTVNGITQTKQIVPQQFTPSIPLPTCVWGAQPDLTLATNYQDLWWATDGQESGWGINFTHQGNIIFATWFTYDSTGKAWWLFSVARETAVPKVYSGDVKTASGPPFDAEPFDPNAVVRTSVGNATIAVIDGNHATFDYTVNGVTQTKHLTRQVFASPGTMCQ